VDVCQNHSYITTDGQSASLSWCQAPIWVTRPDFYYVRQLRVCRCGASSLTGRRVCRLQLLVYLTSAVILGSESRGSRGHILLSQIRDSRNPEGQVPVFLSPRTRVTLNLATVEVFQPASTRGLDVWFDHTYIETYLFRFLFPTADLAEDTPYYCQYAR
jgi:hypothetical protein